MLISGYVKFIMLTMFKELPSFLTSQQTVLQADILRSLGFKTYSPPSVDLCLPKNKDKTAIEKIKRFTDKSQVLESYMAASRILGGSLVLSAISGYGYKYPEGTEASQVYMDGKYGFCLGFKKDGENVDKSYWLAAVSFFASNDDKSIARYWGTHKDIVDNVKNSCWPNAPIIVQLQGCEQYSGGEGYEELKKRTKEVRRMMKSFRWEKALIDIVIEFAHLNNLPAVYVIPASMNLYSTEFKNLPARRGYLRYDKTAERMGFIKEKSGLWALHLVYPED